MFRQDIYPFPQSAAFNEHDFLSQPLAPQETPQLSIEEQLANAHYVAGALRAAICYLGNQTREQRHTASIDTTNSSMADITRSIIRGRPLTVEPTDMVMVSSMAREHPIVRLSPADRLAKSLGQLLRSVSPHANQVSYVTSILDGYDSAWRATLGQKHNTGSVLYPQETRDRLLLDTWDLHKKEGIIHPSDQAGRDYTFAPTGRYIGTANHPEALISALRRSEWGEVDTDAEGALVFHPGPELQNLFGWRRSRPVRLTDQFNLETSTTLYAEAIRQTLQQRSELHIMGPNSRVHEAALLLRAVDSINRQRYHTIGVQNGDWNGTSPEHYALDIARELELQAHAFIANRKRFADFKDFDANEYADRWYGREKPLIDDQQICIAVSTVLRLVGMHAEKAVDLGCGPNLYPGMLILPYAETLDLLDFAPPNRDYVNNYLTGSPTERQLRMWENFIPFMVAGGGNIYLSANTAIRDRAQEGSVRVKPCDVFDLQGNWTLMSAYFLIDSISDYPEDQHLALASMSKSLDDEGLMIIAGMLNQKGHVGYKAGVDKEYPNLSQTAEEMGRACLDNDLFPVIIRLGTDKRKERDGYDGMMLTFACHRGSERQRQLMNLIPELKRLGFDIV